MKPVNSHPWILTKKHGEPRYFRTLADARRVMVEELNALRTSLGVQLGDTDAFNAIGAVLNEVERLPTTGGKIDAVVDPHTGIRYRAEVSKRTVE